MVVANTMSFDESAGRYCPFLYLSGVKAVVASPRFEREFEAVLFAMYVL